MHVPQWLASAFRGVAAPVADAALDVPAPDRSVGWRWLGMFYSAIPDPELPVDPAIVKAIRRSDPEFVPLIAKWVFQRAEADAAAAEILMFKRHAVGRYVRAPKTEKVLFHVDMPTSARFPVPNQLDRILEANHNPYTFTTQRFDSTLPGAYLPFTWDLYYNPWVQLTREELIRRYVTEPRERMETARRKRLEERARMNAELDRYVDKQFEKMGETEMRRLMARRRAGLPLFERPTRTSINFSRSL